MAEERTLPGDFLSSMGPRIDVQYIDFEKEDLPEYKNLYAVILDNVLTPTECKLWVLAAEARTGGVWEPALINIGLGQRELRPDTRNCGRMIWDDFKLAEKVWNRVGSSVQELEYLKNMPDITGNGPAKRKETWQMTRLRERMRFLRYGAGQFFDRWSVLILLGFPKLTRVVAHCDRCHETPDGTERSYFTLHLYLNESAAQGPHRRLRGGATTFHSGNMTRELKVEPKIGRVLIFQQRFLLHSGEEVDSGLKYTMRTDIMYKKV